MFAANIALRARNPATRHWSGRAGVACSRLASQVREYASSKNESVQDYVVVGAGSAGCVLANRLTAGKGNPSVTLLEAGPKDVGDWDFWKIHMPAALTYNLCDDKYNWYYHTEPQPHMNNRVCYWPRGRVWGGSSSLNAMVYIRGHAKDYDRWDKEGAKGWTYADCLPYFRKAQTHELGGDDYRGGSGPLNVSRGRQRKDLFDAFIQAGVEAGYPRTDDLNGYQQEGFGYMDMTIHNGRRWSTAQAYLRPALDRENLDAQVGCFVTRILFDGDKATGVEYIQDGEVKIAHAKKEVILSGGAINSPQLLMLSGVGPQEQLRRHGISVVHDSPGVGENLQDHLELYVQHECLRPITLYTATFPHEMVKIGLEWFYRQTGMGASAHLEAGAFIRSTTGVEHPDLQYHFLPSVVWDHGRKQGDRHAFQAHVGPMRATSVGWLRLKSADPKDHPIMQPNYLQTEQDRREMRDAVKLTREIFAQPAFDSFRGAEMQPGPGVQTDEEIDAFVREKADSAYHPSCTCKMGADSDPMAVTDAETRVRGVRNLRVVDASIMPSVVSGNLNAPVIMMAEKAADIILGRPALPKSSAPVYESPNWQTKQR